jgi:(p)ppGpp synthase/HD superfamily hydrolase
MFNENNARLEAAIEFAATKHVGQVRDNGEPFILHSLRVMCAVDGIEAKTVAVLHDVLEDTDATSDEICDVLRIKQDHIIFEALCFITKDKHVTYDEYIESVSQSSLATTVKLADLKDNLDMLTYNCSDEKKLARCIKHTKAYHILNGSF